MPKDRMPHETKSILVRQILGITPLGPAFKNADPSVSNEQRSLDYILRPFPVKDHEQRPAQRMMRFGPDSSGLIGYRKPSCNFDH